MKAIESVRSIDDAFFELVKSFRVLDYLLPSNRKKERNEFFFFLSQGKRYNPQFEYSRPEIDLEKLRSEIEGLKIEAGPLESLYRNTFSELIHRIDLLLSIGKESFTELSQKIFGVPSLELIQQSEAIIRKTREFADTDTFYGIRMVEEQLREQMTFHRIDGWTVRQEKNTIWWAECDTVHTSINLQPGILANQRMIDQFIRHMIDVSVFRWSNGRRQPLKIFSLGFDRQDETEDGLSLELELRFQPYQDHHLRRYAGRVLAVSQSMKHSFFEVYQELAKYFSPERAYNMTERCKIGLSDTSQNGGFLRDHIFLQGRNKLKALKTPQLKLLYLGKVSIQYLDVLQTLLDDKEILHPAHLPLYLR
ncbi:MAG: DUF1704 domain-containing protein [Bdellovibrionales bacterium]|nr:DUF1704 domain-containing protein [Bdellovibrionales bacterium]